MAPRFTNSVIIRNASSSKTTCLKGPPAVRCFADFLRSGNGQKERVVILGSGWAGYAFARTLDPNKYERIIVSPRSYFVFTPLLASTAVGTLEFRTTLESVRRLGKSLSFHQGWADSIDFGRKVVRVEENRSDDLSSQTILPPPPGPGLPPPVEPPQIPKGPSTDVAYDKLVIAVGAYSQTFGIEGVRQHANFLRDVGDARKIRLRVLSIFEQCASPAMSEESRSKLLHFAIVGGGPTGIEFAGELHDLIKHDLAKLYPCLMHHVRISVYDVADKILPMFDKALASYAMGLFNRQNISIKTNHSIQRVTRDAETGGIQLKVKQNGGAAKDIFAGIVVWSTGLMQNPLVEKLLQSNVPGGDQLEKDPRTGGIVVDERLRARLVKPGEAPPARVVDSKHPQPPLRLLDDVFVIGDCAVIASQSGLPKTAQVASQEAAYLAKALNKSYGDSSKLDEAKPFKFRNMGTLTYLGNWKAIHQSGADRLTGWVAWVLWRTAYLTRSMSLKNKVLLPVYWFVSWCFGRDISRF